MDLLQNPFYLLTATQRDNRQKIIDLAEERSLLSDVDKCMAATGRAYQSTQSGSLLKWHGCPALPRKVLMIYYCCWNHPQEITSVVITLHPHRLLHSPRLLFGHPMQKKSNIADEVLETLKLSKGNFTEVGEFLGINTLTPIARANLLAARMLRLPDYTLDIIAEWILAIAEAFENINPSDIRATLNTERKESGFPEITELSDITSEIQNCRRYYQQVIKFVLENIPTAKARVKVVMMVIESATDNDTGPWPILVEDTVDAYEEGAATFLETVEINIDIQNKKIRIAADAETPDTDFTSIVDEDTVLMNTTNSVFLKKP